MPFISPSQAGVHSSNVHSVQTRWIRETRATKFDAPDVSVCWRSHQIHCTFNVQNAWLVARSTGRLNGEKSIQSRMYVINSLFPSACLPLLFSSSSSANQNTMDPRQPSKSSSNTNTSNTSSSLGNFNPSGGLHNIPRPNEPISCQKKIGRQCISRRGSSFKMYLVFA